MTGFGTARGQLSDRFAVGAVVRAVNNRYLDVQVRLSFREEMPEVEAAVRKEVERVAQRGRIVVQVDFQRLEPPNSRVLVNRTGLEDLMGQLDGLGVSAGGVRGGSERRSTPLLHSRLHSDNRFHQKSGRNRWYHYRARE